MIYFCIMNFKKHISILLTFLVLVSSTGIAFNVHYCDNKIESISLKIKPFVYSEVDECCGIVEKDSKCCTDKIIKSDFKLDQIISKKLSFTTFYTINNKDWEPIFLKQIKSNSINNVTYSCKSNAPPLYLLFHQYIFYA